MFQQHTYEKIMERALSRVPSNVDARQGSIIFDAIAPACAELAKMYIELDNILNLTFAETSYGDWLEMRCREMGVQRRNPTNAIRMGVMHGADNTLIDVPINARFSIETLNYVVIERLSQGHFKLQCEQHGVVGNQLFGRLIPVDNIRNLARAELKEIIVPGEDTESDESLYKRYEERVNTSAFGGNIDEYKLKTKSIDGVGECKIFPVWNGGGTVKVTLIDSSYNSPSSILVERVQNTLDPIPQGQQGKGTAPIGHLVTVEGVEDLKINIDSKLILTSGLTVGQVYEDVESAILNYLLSLRQNWANEDNIVIRVAQLISYLIRIDGVEDVGDIRINGEDGNLILGESQIPVKGVINLYE